MRFLGCSVAWLLLVSLSLRNFLSCSLIRSETNRINVSSSTRKVAIPWPMWKGEKEFLWWWLHDRIEKKRKRENSFFHKRAKTFPRDPSLFPLVSHVYRLTKNEERVAKDSQQEASTRLRKKEMKFFFDLDASFILARFFLHRTMSSSLVSLSFFLYSFSSSFLALTVR